MLQNNRRGHKIKVKLGKLATMSCTYITCRRFLILRSKNSSCMAIALPATIVLAGSKKPGIPPTGRRCSNLKRVERILTLAGEKKRVCGMTLSFC